MPMAFPNGYVYSTEVRYDCSFFMKHLTAPSSQALEEMAAKNNGKVICPRSSHVCDFTALKKVFIS